jgi:hypothetical protein
MKRNTIAFLAVMSSLYGCGGGSVATDPGLSTPTTNNIVAPAPVTVKYSLSSYENVKNLDFSPKSVPQWPSINGGSPTITLESFFKFKDGTVGYLGTLQIYSNTNNAGPDTAAPGLLRMWKYVNGDYQFTDIIDSGPVKACIHLRKILPADLNQDGNIDFVFICHGWDYAPFPGEKNRVLLSQPNGRYTLDYMSDDIGFWHGGTTMDVNGDGYPDVVAVNPSKTNDIRFFLNDKTGRFNLAPEMTIRPPVQPDYIPPPGWNHVPEPSVSTIDAIDINGDGKHDLVVGGQDWQSPTVIMINPGNGDFTKAEQITIPRLDTQGLGNVMDFVYIPANKSLYVLRTSGCFTGCEFYRGVYIQKVSLAAGLKTNLLTSSIVYNNPAQNWELWIDEFNGYVSTPLDRGLFSIRVE